MRKDIKIENMNIEGEKVKVSVSNILEVFEKDLYKGCFNKKKLYLFEKNKVSSIQDNI